MKRTTLIATLLLCTILTGCHFLNADTVYNIESPSYEKTTQGLNSSSVATVTNASENKLFTLKPAKKGQQHFINHANGYSLILPDSFKVIDMADATYRSTLGDESTRLEIYTQTLDPKTVTPETYLNYSNQFLKNTKEFKKTFDTTFNTGQRTTHLFAYNRRALSGIKNDRNHYAIIDTIEGNRVISIQLASTKPLCKKKLLTYVDSLVFSKPSETAKNYPRFAPLRDNLNKETKTFYINTFSEEAPFSWGLFEPTLSADTSGKLPHLKKSLNDPFNILLYYSSLEKNYRTNSIYDTLTAIKNEGATTELTLQTPLYDPLTEKNAIFNILDGQYDAFLHAYAKDIARFGHPVLFRPFNEMNGDWCNYSAFWAGRDCSIYIELYRHIYNIFEEEGANANTLWVWNPNERSYPNFTWNAIDNYYPGDEYVDIVGLTGYNTGDYYEGETWRSFKNIYDPIYETMEPRYQQPLMITEFSCSDIGGNKAAWINDMFKQLPHYPRIKAAVWWNSADYDTNGTIARSYFIDNNEENLAAFKDGLAKN